jgi:hypothetical protein
MIGASIQKPNKRAMDFFGDKALIERAPPEAIGSPSYETNGAMKMLAAVFLFY